MRITTKKLKELAVDANREVFVGRPYGVLIEEGTLYLQFRDSVGRRKEVWSGPPRELYVAMQSLINITGG